MAEPSDPEPPSGHASLVRSLVPEQVPGPGEAWVDDEVIVTRGADGTLCAARNRCRHRAGRFACGDAPGPLTCPRHGWGLGPRSMHYLSASGGLTHPQLAVRERADGRVDLSEHGGPRPWEQDQRPPERLERGELTLTYLTHACVEVRYGAHRILTDPWLEGPAFTRGWWLAHRPPPDWPDRLARADVVYLSHDHSDHLHAPTLRRLASEIPEVTVVVPDLPGRSCAALARRFGLRHMVALTPGTWLVLDVDTRLTLLADGSGRQDTALLVDHRGHLVLDTVDCPDPNGGLLPDHVDVLLAPFAGGASGYPLCWPDQYTETEIQRRLAVARPTLSARAVDLAMATSADVFVPFAGSFTEAHPSDADLQRRNRKNRAADVARSVTSATPATRAWMPTPGARLDVATAEPTEGGDPRVPASHRATEFARYLPPIAASRSFAPLGELDGVDHYRRWLGYEGDLVLHVRETDESYTRQERELFVDFERGEVGAGPPRERPTCRRLAMTVRCVVFRHVLRHGLGWEEISIGFQARWSRDPDRYEWDFWDHVQNRVPDDPPWPADEDD